MIQQIKKLKKFGIFQDFKSSKDLKEFSRYNLFYGWNGSGKSTLAKLFFSIADKKIYILFPNSEFCLSIKEQVDLTNRNIETNSLNIKVFNKDFIDRNVNFEESKANSILILSEKKKEEVDRYKILQQQYAENSSTYEEDKRKYEKLVGDLKRDLSKWASKIKKSFELIETSNSQLLNYNITKLNAFIREHKGEINYESVLSLERVKKLKDAIKPTSKPDIDRDLVLLDIQIKDFFLELKELLGKSIFSQQIERLKENPDINQWVKAGLDIHNLHKSKTCEFCGQVLHDDRIDRLNKHFSRDYLNLIERLNAFDKGVEKLLSTLCQKTPEIIEFYDEFQNEYQKSRIEYLEICTTCIEFVERAKEKIRLKTVNPFETIYFEYNTENIFCDYNEKIRNIQTIIQKNNTKNQEFDEQVKLAQFKLELHFVSEVLIEEKYFTTEKEILQAKMALDTKKTELERLHTEMEDLEARLINETKGAQNFNDNLARFIGRKDISLEFDKDLKGYKLLRAGKSEPATNLSEGEKTAIAFVYFIAKLRENGNQIEKTIIVVDDPISSFDSNHLFHAYAYLKQECETALQLFVFTHSFQFFKLVRDWFLKKNDPKKDILKSHFYFLECTTEEDRQSTIKNADSTLLNYNSEYHYIYHKLHELRKLQSLSLEEAFLVANLSRKLLEGFLAFKFPKKRKDFRLILQLGCKMANIEVSIEEKVYRFINMYSHDRQIEFDDTPIDNLLGESQNIIEYVFEILSQLDETHYSEMEEVCCTIEDE